MLAAGGHASRWLLRGVVRPHEYCIIVFWNWKQGHNKAFPTCHYCVRESFVPRFVIVRIRGLRVAGLEVCTYTVAVFGFCTRCLWGFGRSEKKKRNLNLQRANLDRRGVENYTGRNSKILLVKKSRKMDWLACLACMMEMIILFENGSAPRCHLKGVY